MKSDTYEIELESKIDNLPVISDFVEESLTDFQVDAALINKVQVCVDEACTNVISYAYPGGTGPLKIALKLVGEDIWIVIQDKGKPFDPTSIPPPDVTSEVDQRKIGGLGIYFMHELMDSVSYSFDPLEGNQLTLRKRRSPATNGTV